MEMSASFHCAVGVRDFLSDVRRRWESPVDNQQGSRRGVLAQEQQRVRPQQRRRDEVPDAVSRCLEQLGNEWLFLGLVARSICWSEEVKNQEPGVGVGVGHRSILDKIDAVGFEIIRHLWRVDTLTRQEELLELIGHCRRKTDELSEEEIRVVVQDLSNSRFHLRRDPNFWSSLIFDVRDGVAAIKDDVRDGCLNRQLSALHIELGFIQLYLDGTEHICGFSRDSTIDAFFAQFRHLVLRITVGCCNFWVNRRNPETAKITATGLADLLHEIDPANPEFLQLNLRFQKALAEFISKKLGTYLSFFHHFSRYLLLFDCNNVLKNELESLVTLLFNDKLVDNSSSSEDVLSFFAEIVAVFAEVAFLHRAVLRNTIFSDPTDLGQYASEDLPPCSDLLVKIRLLKTELLLKELLNYSSTSSVLFNDRFSEVRKFLANPREFGKDLCKQGNSEYVKQSLVLSQELASELESHLGLNISNEMANSLTKHTLLQLLFKIVFFKAESYLRDLFKSSDKLLSHERDQLGSLVEELIYFKRVITNKLARESSEEKTIILQIEAVVRRIIFFSYSFLPDNDKLEKVIRSLPQLMDKVKIVSAKLREISPFPRFIFPKTYGLGIIDLLGGKIRELLTYYPNLIAPVKHHFKDVQLRLESFKSFLVKVEHSDVELGGLKDLANHIINVAYKLEYVVDSVQVDGLLEQSLPQSIWLYDLLEDIKQAHEQVPKTHEMPYSIKNQNLPQISCQMISRHLRPAMDEMMVDLGDEEEDIIDRLKRGSSQRDVVCIVGMPGIGKTTLAKKVYNNKNIMYHFNRRAWCTVSQVFSKRELLLEILSDMCGITDEVHRMTDEDLISKLRRCLLRNRYLIVMDDVWDIKAWNDLEKSFPDGSCGSRILITSRHRDVALKIKPDCDPHFVRFFSDDESWMLLEKRTFKGEVCPAELLQVGLEIAQHCQGLPLAVVAIAGLLQKSSKTQDSWKSVLKSLSSEVINEPENRCLEILELSYKHLPEYLKACFLYLGFFLEDRDISVSKLIRFWMAEGFIEETKSKILEDVAEDNLMELINRSLVIISKTRSNGKVKACRLHDLLRDLCLLKAKEENFFHLVTRVDKPYSSFPDSDYGMELYFDDELAPITYESYRLGFYLKRKHFIDSRPCGPGTRSLLFFASGDSDPRCPYDILCISCNFKLLAVLDLECINMGLSFPVEIGQMIHLRYLAVSGYIRSIPPSIANLWKLETLIVKGLRGKVLLPDTIWRMASLRHLHVNNLVAFSLQGLDEQVGSSFDLDSLVSFSTPLLSCEEATISILKRLPNLRKMRCVWYSSKNCNAIPMLNFLSHLESLKMIYAGGALNSEVLVFPLNLKKLTLSNFRLPWLHISSIGRLPNLRVLKLLAGAFEGKIWDMNEKEFKELKFLELDTLNIAEWNASCDHLPNLEQLVLRNCNDLEQIPCDFANILTLQMIQVQWCRKSEEESAKEIGDATGEIKVFISHS